MPAIFAKTAHVFEFGDIIFTRLAAPQTGSVETSLWKFQLPANSDGDLHQISREEIMVILTGTARAEIGAERHELAQGDAIVIPANTDFRLSVTSGTPVEGLAMVPVGAEAKMPGQAAFVPPWTT